MIGRAQVVAVYAPAGADRLVKGPKSSTGTFYDPVPGPQCCHSTGQESLEERVDETLAGHTLQVSVEHWRAAELGKNKAPWSPVERIGGRYYPAHARWYATALTEVRSNQSPPVQVGDRWTTAVTSAGKRKIANSADYLYSHGRGYRTFLTLTFSDEWRRQIVEWDRQAPKTEGRRSIGALATEFFNNLQQRYRNGKTFGAHYRRAGKKRVAHNGGEFTPIVYERGYTLRGKRVPFEFTWVIENPENESGERNPHIHCLLTWAVSRNHFHSWSLWVERVWGKGFAHLERLKKPECAGGYIGKAAGYISKKNGASDQGPVRGNRYSISKKARAPGKQVIGIYWADFIREVIKLGCDAGREKWPMGLWFHEHGFGCSDVRLWGDFWSRLKADGWRFRPPPVSLLVARWRNAGEELLKRLHPDHDYLSTFFNWAEFYEREIYQGA